MEPPQQAIAPGGTPAERLEGLGRGRAAVGRVTGRQGKEPLPARPTGQRGREPLLVGARVVVGLLRSEL